MKARHYRKHKQNYFAHERAKIRTKYPKLVRICSLYNMRPLSLDEYSLASMQSTLRLARIDAKIRTNSSYGARPSLKSTTQFPKSIITED